MIKQIVPLAKNIYLKTFQTGIITFYLIFTFSLSSDGQDEHYLSQQYGALSTIMGGAMVGGVNDNSAIYYNQNSIFKSKLRKTNMN